MVAVDAHFVGRAVQLPPSFTKLTPDWARHFIFRLNVLINLQIIDVRQNCELAALPQAYQSKLGC